ncbi:hypothetical protein BDW22DRAFT_122665 [Trametopsis cervina]|nr:hypothetical protein BDW22DRAFT_122665 [Trametopsis cervina]
MHGLTRRTRLLNFQGTRRDRRTLIARPRGITIDARRRKSIIIKEEGGRTRHRAAAAQNHHTTTSTEIEGARTCEDVFLFFSARCRDCKFLPVLLRLRARTRTRRRKIGGADIGWLTRSPRSSPLVAYARTIATQPGHPRRLRLGSQTRDTRDRRRIAS